LGAVFRRAGRDAPLQAAVASRQANLARRIGCARLSRRTRRRVRVFTAAFDAATLQASRLIVASPVTEAALDAAGAHVAAAFDDAALQDIRAVVTAALAPAALAPVDRRVGCSRVFVRRPVIEATQARVERLQVQLVDPQHRIARRPHRQRGDRENGKGEPPPAFH
jgi:hypothetical protein